jgi:hypothetical protein
LDSILLLLLLLFDWSDCVDCMRLGPVEKVEGIANRSDEGGRAGNGGFKRSGDDEDEDGCKSAGCGGTVVFIICGAGRGGRGGNSGLADAVNSLDGPLDRCGLEGGSCFGTLDTEKSNCEEDEDEEEENDQRCGSSESRGVSVSLFRSENGSFRSSSDADWTADAMVLLDRFTLVDGGTCSSCC